YNLSEETENWVWKFLSSNRISGGVGLGYQFLVKLVGLICLSNFLTFGSTWTSKFLKARSIFEISLLSDSIVSGSDSEGSTVGKESRVFRPDFSPLPGVNCSSIS
ncbi:unnamed protein product, partial [Prunus brigantina]